MKQVAGLVEELGHACEVSADEHFLSASLIISAQN
jgi:hypothetical protein